MSRRLHYSILMVLLIGLMTAGPLATFAQEPPAAAPLAENTEPLAEETANGAQDSEDALRERNIYIPYEKLREVFEQHGRGVFLPYEEFETLWRLARENAKPRPEQKPPVGALISEIHNEATVVKDVIQVKARLKIEILAEGWNEIPLRLSDAAIASATIDGKPARIIGNPGEQYRLLIKKQGKEPQQIELALEYHKSITRTPGRKSVSVEAPQAPVSHWEVRIPEPDVKVNIFPLIAAAEADAADADDTTVPQETIVRAFVGAAATVRIDWNAKAEGATGLTALVSVQTQQQVWISEGVIRTDTTLDYAISRADLSQITLDIPADHKLVNVRGSNVRQPTVEPVEDGATTRRVTVELFEPAKKSQQVTVELEKFTVLSDAVEQSQETLEVPVVRAVDVARQQGLLMVHIDDGLQAEAATASGLLQFDRNELPKALAGTDWSYCYRFGTVPFDLKLVVSKVQPRIETDTLVEAYLEPQRLSLDVSVVYSIEQAGVFQLRLDVPEPYRLRKVIGRPVAGSQPAEVDDDHFEGTGDSRQLVVNLSRKAFEKVGLLVELERELPEKEDLLSYTGKTVDLPMAIPRVTLDPTIKRADGHLIVHAPKSLEVGSDTTAGFRSVTFKEALEQVPSGRSKKPADSTPVLALGYGQQPERLSLNLKRRKPQVSVSQLFVARIENGAVNYEATFNYEVLYSSKESLRIDVPLGSVFQGGGDEDAQWRLDSQDLQKEIIEPAPEDLRPGYEAWRLTHDAEFLGKRVIKLIGKRQMTELSVGNSIPLTIPRLQPREVDHAWGQIVLAKAEMLDVYDPEDQRKGLLEIDPQRDVIAPVEGGARAFEFHGDWNLTIVARRYELVDIKRTSIECGVVRMVVARRSASDQRDEISVQALYRMRSARPRLVVKLPEKPVFEHDALKINGVPVTLEGEKDEYFVPLLDCDPREPFLLELRYKISGDGSRFQLPEFPLEPAVQKIYLCAYLPEERTLLGTRGPWTEEFRLYVARSLRWRPTTGWVNGRPVNSDRKFFAQVMEGVEGVTGDPFGGFATDGQLFAYSTLRPAQGVPGMLRTVTYDERLLTMFVFAGVMLGGVVLLPARASARTITIGVFVTILVLTGVFLPTFWWQVCDATMGGAIFLVFVLWAVWYLVKTRPRMLALRQAGQSTVPPPAASFTTPSQHGQDLSTSEAETGDEADEPPPPEGSKPTAAEGPEPPSEGPGESDSEEGGKSDV